MIRRVTFALAGSLLVGAAIAKAPPIESQDYQVMKPYADQITKLMRPDTGTGCCNLSDCRPTDIKTVTDKDGTHYQAFIRHREEDGSGWYDGPDRFLTVPDSVIIHKSEVPLPVACWAKWQKDNNGFFCLTLGNSG